LTGGAIPDLHGERATAASSGGSVVSQPPAAGAARTAAAAAEATAEDARIIAAVAAVPATRWKCSDCVGSPGFIAPEVMVDDSYDGRAADVWSLGCVAIELRESSVGDAFDRTWYTA
jgi:serine/threonine protein kinase